MSKLVHLRRALVLSALCVLPATLAGCAAASAVEAGHNTALDSINLTEMTDKMAASIAASHPVQDTIAREGPLKIVIQPVENMMTGEILPRGQAEAFTVRIRALLSQHAPDQYVWVMNRDAFYRLRGSELEGSLGPSPEAINPQYALWGTFYSITDESSRHRSSAYLCKFELTDLQRRTILWQDSYQVKKSTVKGFLD